MASRVEPQFPPYTLTSAADLSGKEGYGYQVDASGKAVLAGAGAVNGVIRDGGTASGDPVSVVPGGCGARMRVLLGGNVDEDDYLTTDAAGKFIATTTSTDEVIGRALHNGAADQRRLADLCGYVTYP